MGGIRKFPSRRDLAYKSQGKKGVEDPGSSHLPGTEHRRSGGVNKRVGYCVPLCGLLPNPELGKLIKIRDPLFSLGARTSKAEVSVSAFVLCPPVQLLRSRQGPLLPRPFPRMLIKNFWATRSQSQALEQHPPQSPQTSGWAGISHFWLPATVSYSHLTSSGSAAWTSQVGHCQTSEHEGHHLCASCV